MRKFLSSGWLIMALLMAFVAWVAGWRVACVLLLFGFGTDRIWRTIEFAINIKFALLLSTQPSTPRETDLTEWPRRDSAKWEEITSEWRSLGFELCDTRAFGEATPALGIELSQIWICSKAAATVQVAQTFLPQRTSPLKINIVSYWGDAAATLEMAAQLEAAAQGTAQNAAPIAAPQTPKSFSERLPIYSCGVSNQGFNWVYHLFLHPQVMGKVLDGAAPHELWEVHLNRRQVVSRALKMEPLGTDLRQLSKAHSDLMRAIWHRRLQRGFMLKLLRARWSGEAPNESWGELDAQIRALST